MLIIFMFRQSVQVEPRILKTSRNRNLAKTFVMFIIALETLDVNTSK